MQLIQIVRDLFAIAVLATSLAFMLVAINNPQSVGKWLHQIDQGRWGQMECVDCDLNGFDF